MNVNDYNDIINELLKSATGTFKARINNENENNDDLYECSKKTVISLLIVRFISDLIMSENPDMINDMIERAESVINGPECDA